MNMCHYSRAHGEERHLGNCQTDTTWILEHFLSICPLGLVARHWAVVNRVRAAGYARSRTAAVNGECSHLYP